jgi:hypothetical protein
MQAAMELQLIGLSGFRIDCRDSGKAYYLQQDAGNLILRICDRAQYN